MVDEAAGHKKHSDSATGAPMVTAAPTPDTVQKTAAQSATPTITGVILTCDGERMLELCLASLDFCDALLVVDCGSSDASLRIAATAGATVLSRDWQGFASQFTYAADQVRTDWFFILDQDERCTPELGRAISAAIAGAAMAGAGPVAFSVNRRSWYFDRFMRHSGWSPDHILRVFQRGCVTFSQDSHIHYHPTGPRGHISQGEIIHYPYTGFDHQLNKLNVYAEQGAQSLRDRGKRGGVIQGTAHGLAKFFRLYVLKAGFLDGRAGFIAAVHGAFYTFIKYVRVLDATWGKPYTHK